MQMGIQTDFILLDFSKAFDTVGNEEIIQNVHHYGIRGDTLNWIKDFLDNRKQAVAINGKIQTASPPPLAPRRTQVSVQFFSKLTL